jgi:integrase
MSATTASRPVTCGWPRSTRSFATSLQCQRILGIPFKRARSRPIEYFEYDEIQAVLAAVDRTTADGRRDYTLLAAMFNTGARVQEILDLRPCDLQLVKPLQVRLVGKGRKERLCPLWPQTAELLSSLLSESGMDPRSTEPLFRNHRGEPLTRFGVRYLLAKYCDRARASTPTLAAKRLHPHSMRHSTAVHLLKAGVDLTTISHWLGHASVNTTNRYVTIDLEMKREAIAKAKPVDDGSPLRGPSNVECCGASLLDSQGQWAATPHYCGLTISRVMWSST